MSSGWRARASWGRCLVALAAVLTGRGFLALPRHAPALRLSTTAPGPTPVRPAGRIGVTACRALEEEDVDDFYEQDNEELMAMLMSGTGDDVDILGNGSLVKTIIRPAPAFSRRPQLGDEVTVHFIGSLEDGTVFDDTRARHEPYTFRVGLGFVIGGWDKGIPTMMKGERALFDMDSSVAYGAAGAGWKIPPNAKVRFDIELLGWEEIDDMGPDDVEPEWEAPLVGRDDVGEGGKDPFGKYSWQRNGLEVLVKAQIPDDTSPKEIHAEFFPRRVLVSVKGQVILSGTPGIDLDWEECYWDLNREEEIAEDPQAKLWLLIHLYKKDAAKVRWPDYLLTEHIPLSTEQQMEEAGCGGEQKKKVSYSNRLKPGQYQDLIILGATGTNLAYTYLNTDYGDMGREKDSECFGFSGNVSGSEANGAYEAAIEELKKRGMPDVELIANFGRDPRNRYFYTMVLDSDTICPGGSIRQLIEAAEHSANRNFGIINANLAVDYTSAEDCTWHMWRNALMEVSTVNLVRGQFWIFNRTGFYGKGLVRNDMYISRLIGAPGNLVEALPVDILSHDTVEAKLLQPAVDINVTLYEDVARNPISALSQSTRWMLGEVRNACYHPDGSYKGIISLLTTLYSCLVECKKRPKVWVRWRDVPCSVAAEYLSHTGFRLFHAGPGILLVNIFTSLLAQQKYGLELQVLPVVGMYAFLFTVLALFIIPKGFLMLDKLTPQSRVF
ncbi:unnamed protein product [Effrenium voratum]|nr:unnamed protein product [Effrenium voratum]